MKICPPIADFAKTIRRIDQAAKIEKDKENPLRYDVWGTKSSEVKSMIEQLTTEALPKDKRNSVSIFNKLEGTFKRIINNTHKAESFKSDIAYSEDNIEMSIALYELIESVKGESDKSRKYDVNLEELLTDGILPSVMLARFAASVGRKILYQKGYRMANSAEAETKVSSAEVESLYASAGMAALKKLESEGYVTFDTGSVIKDYIEEGEKNEAFPKVNTVVKNVKVVSLNTKKLKIKKDSQEALYFLNRQDSDISNTELSTITGILSAVRQVTQPTNYRAPDKTEVMTDEDYKDVDAQGIHLDGSSDEVRKQLYKNSLKVNGAVHDFFTLLHKEVKDSGIPASKLIKDIYKNTPDLVESLFGFKDLEDFSVDKSESVSGQNLSKSTAIDDIAEYYDLLMENGKPANLHMPLKVGRNQRLYYLNTVLNAHASKQSRYMITPGIQTIKVGSDNAKYLVRQVAESLSNDITHEDVLKGTNKTLEKALGVFDSFNDESTLKGKLEALSHLPALYKGLDYVTLTTALQAVKDIRNASNGVIKTEFAVSADATASGGTLTFFQALGTNPKVREFLESLGMFPDKEGNINATASDVYSLMTNAVEDFIKSPKNKGMASSLEDTVNPKEVIQDTLKLLFNHGKNSREFAKSPTMTFVYQQGEAGAITSMTTDLADRIMDSLDDLETRVYLSKLFKDSAYLDMTPAELKTTKGLYKDIREALVDSKLPETLYNLLNTAIKDKYLKEYQKRSSRIFNLVKSVLGNKVIKILPSAAVLEGKVASKDLKDFGMPIAKVFEIMHKLPDGTEVLTREQLLHKTIMDVSTIHGIDSALLYLAIKDANLKEGVVVVHDEIRGSVEAVRAVEAAYAKRAQQVLSEYDIHEQMLESLKAYHPEIVNNLEYQSLVKDVTKSVKEKQETAKDFNLKTSALIGDGNAHVEFASESKSKKQKGKPTVTKFLEILSEKSDLIKTFLGVFDTKVIEGENFQYDPSSDTVTVKVGRNNEKAAIEAVEHEIVHAATLARIHNILNGEGTAEEQRDVKYIQKSIEDLKNIRNASEKLKDRISYITAQPEENQVAEFVAIMSSESSIATEVYQNIKGSRFKNILTRLLKAIKENLGKIFEEDFNKDVDATKLFGAVHRTVHSGIADRVERQQETIDTLKKIEGTLGFDKRTKLIDIDFLNKAAARLITERAEEGGKGLIRIAHNTLKDYPAYSEVIDKFKGIYDSSEDLQGLLHAITGEDIDKKKKAKRLAEYAKVSLTRNDFVNQNTKEFDAILRDMTKEDKALLDLVIHKVPLYEYFVSSKELNTPEKIQAAIKTLEKELKSHAGTLSDINSLVDLSVSDKVTGDTYTLGKYSSSSDYHAKARKLLTLKIIEKVGSEKFTNLLQNEALSSKLEDLTLANYLSTLGIKGTEHLRVSAIPHLYKEGIQQRAITLKELSQYEYGDTSGWKIVREPTETSLGLVYREVIDSTSLPGIFTDIKMTYSDISTLPEYSKFDNVIKTATGYKMVVKEEDRKAMGSLGGVESLIRSTAHSMAIQESQIIRDALLKDDVFSVSAASVDELEGILKDDTQDNPWFLKSEGMSYGKLPDSVKAKYKPVGKRISDVNNFNENVTWVRKDIAHWLTGGDRASPFVDPKWKWGIRITKDLVSMAKIGMVVLNPGKIARDNISNLSYLGVMGVGPLEALKSYNEIMQQFGEYSEVKNQMIKLKVQLAAKPNSDILQKKQKALEKKLKSNPISSIEDKGFLNSLGSTIVSKESEGAGTLHKDINTALTYLLKDGKGKNNYLSHFLLQLQKVGGNGEDFLGYLGSLVGKHKTGKELDNVLSEVEERLKTIRTEKDTIAYASQFINAPQSQAVKIGAHITDLVDVLAKETYYRHLVDKGMEPEDAKIEVLDSFPNYIENMPLAVQQASDLGIIMFPSFWLRIQKVIYRMAKDKPLSLATEEAIDSYFNLNVDNIVDSNIANKAVSWGGFFHSPLEMFGFSMFFPTHAISL